MVRKAGKIRRNFIKPERGRILDFQVTAPTQSPINGPAIASPINARLWPAPAPDLRVLTAP